MHVCISMAFYMKGAYKTIFHITHFALKCILGMNSQLSGYFLFGIDEIGYCYQKIQKKATSHIMPYSLYYVDVMEISTRLSPSQCVQVHVHA